MMLFAHTDFVSPAILFEATASKMRTYYWITVFSSFNPLISNLAVPFRHLPRLHTREPARHPVSSQQLTLWLSFLCALHTTQSASEAQQQICHVIRYRDAYLLPRSRWGWSGTYHTEPYVRTVWPCRLLALSTYSCAVTSLRGMYWPMFVPICSNFLFWAE